MKIYPLVLISVAALSPYAFASDSHHRGGAPGVQLGPRPFFLVEDMAESRLKRKLESCSNGPFRTTD